MDRRTDTIAAWVGIVAFLTLFWVLVIGTVWHHISHDEPECILFEDSTYICGQGHTP